MLETQLETMLKEGLQPIAPLGPRIFAEDDIVADEVNRQLFQRTPADEPNDLVSTAGVDMLDAVLGYSGSSSLRRRSQGSVKPEANTRESLDYGLSTHEFPFFRRESVKRNGLYIEYLLLTDDVAYEPQADQVVRSGRFTEAVSVYNSKSIVAWVMISHKAQPTLYIEVGDSSIVNEHGIKDKLERLLQSVGVKQLIEGEAQVPYNGDPVPIVKALVDFIR